MKYLPSLLPDAFALSVFFIAMSASALAVPVKVCGKIPSVETGHDITQKLQALIDHCASHGGGIVTLNSGNFLSGPLLLRSHINLHLDAGSVLQTIDKNSLYRPAYINWPWSPAEAFLSLPHVEDVAITGEGTIDGNGEGWWKAAQEAKKNRRNNFANNIPLSNGLPRPWLIESYDAHNILISDVHITRSPMWNIVLRYTDNAIIKHIDINNPADSPNTDGIDVITSQNVTLSDNTISTGDDDIAIKSGLPGTTLPNKTTKNIYITDTAIGAGHGLSIGSETIFNIENVYVYNVDFNGTSNGIRIKSGRDRGSVLQHYVFDKIRMNNVRTGLSISAYYPHFPKNNDSSAPVTVTTPRISDIRISHLTEKNVQKAGIFIGLPEMPLQNIDLSYMNLATNASFIVRNALLHTDTSIKIMQKK